jgi:hypothetical protein
MRNYKAYFSTLLILAFIYLVMCPSVHKPGYTIRHDVTIKTGEKIQQKNINKSFTANPFKSFYKIQTENFLQPRILEILIILSSLHPTLKGSILSSVRLIL